MSIKNKRHSKYYLTQKEIQPKIECHSKLNVTKNGMSLKMKSYLKWNVI